ncbi:MAG TPA: cyanoexosortase A [Crinalium sp.]
MNWRDISLSSPNQLAGLGLGFIALHLTLTWLITKHADQVLLNGLFWGAIASLIWQKRDRLSVQRDRLSRFIGFALLACLLLKSVSLSPFDSAFVRLLPGWIALTLGVFTSGWCLVQYKRELLLILTLMVPQGSVSTWIEQGLGIQIQTAIAQFATFLLHYLGLDVTRRGVEITVPHGAVEVQYGCAGIPVLILLIQLSILLLMTHSANTIKRLQILILATSTAFLLSTIRVAIMTVVVNHQETFEYWHGNQGAQFFSTLAILIFVGFSNLILDNRIVVRELE